MESNTELAEKYNALLKEYNQTLKDAIATEVKYAALKEKHDSIEKELATKQCELLREIGECNSLTNERDALNVMLDTGINNYNRLKERCDKIVMEHADLNLALAAMLNGYQNLSPFQRDAFTVPKDLIDAYTKMVLEYDTPDAVALKEGGSNTPALGEGREVGNEQ